jgi:enoyl-CoA hydratase/carnithine racemase
MVRTLTQALLDWRDDADIRAVVIRSSSEKAFCAGGDIRFFYERDRATPQRGPAAVTPDMIAQFFMPAWPAHAHPLRDLR